MFKKIISYLFLISAFVFSFSLAFADTTNMDGLVTTDSSGNAVLGTDSIKTVTQNTLSQKTVPDIISSGIKIALGFFGVIALVFVIWGGVDWMLSKGDPKKIGAARDRMIAAAIGLAIIAASYAITDFIISQISVIAG